MERPGRDATTEAFRFGVWSMDVRMRSRSEVVVCLETSYNTCFFSPLGFRINESEWGISMLKMKSAHCRDDHQEEAKRGQTTRRQDGNSTNRTRLTGKNLDICVRHAMQTFCIAEHTREAAACVPLRTQSAHDKACSFCMMSREMDPSFEVGNGDSEERGPFESDRVK